MGPVLFTPLPKLSDPRIVGDVLFRGEDAGQTPEQLERRRPHPQVSARSRLADAQRLQGRLGAAVARKLVQVPHRRPLGQAAPGVFLVRPRWRQASGRVTALGAAAAADLMVLGCLRPCRASSLVHVGQWCVDYWLWTPFIGVPGAHTSSRATRTNPDTQAELRAINTYELQVLLYLLDWTQPSQRGCRQPARPHLICLSSDVPTAAATATTTCRCCSAGRLGCGHPARSPPPLLPASRSPASTSTILAAIGQPQPRFGGERHRAADRTRAGYSRCLYINSPPSSRGEAAWDLFGAPTEEASQDRGSAPAGGGPVSDGQGKVAPGGTLLRGAG